MGIFSDIFGVRVHKGKTGNTYVKTGGKGRKGKTLFFTKDKEEGDIVDSFFKLFK